MTYIAMKAINLPLADHFSLELHLLEHRRGVTPDQFVTEPSSFANRGGKGRNAWRFVWLRFPGESCWIRAADWRARQEQESLRRLKAREEVSMTV